MTEAQRLLIRASEQRQKLNELAALDTLTDEQRGELDTLTASYSDTERQTRAAVLAESEEAIETHATTETLDSETRERNRLREKATFGGFLSAAAAGRLPGGELHEYASACGSEDGQVPLDLFESDRPPVELHDDAVTTGPSTGTGSTLAAIQPYIFSDSIAARLGISMPQVPSGSHSWARISTPLTAGAKTKGTAQESTAAVLTAVSTSPRRISARLSVEAEDLASIGTSTFEPALRSNLTGAMSNAYDEQCDQRFRDGSERGRPDSPTDAGRQSDGGRGLRFPVGNGSGLRRWHVGANTARSDHRYERGHVSEIDHDVPGRRQQSQGRGSGDRTYLTRVLGGWSSAARMPAAPTTGGNANIAPAIVRRTGRSLLAAVHPTWGSMSIDDIYTDSASARRHYTLHVLVGAAVLIIQPDAYALALFKLA